jgi:hypothetical protein
MTSYIIVIKYIDNIRMAKIMDDFGYIIKIPEEEMKAIHLVDNGINPYKKIRNKSLQNKVRSEYKRRLIINIVGLIVKSPRHKTLLIKNLQIKSRKKPIIKQIQKKLHKMSMKHLDNLYKSLLQHGKTKKKKIPKHSKTRKLRK